MAHVAILRDAMLRMASQDENGASTATCAIVGCGTEAHLRASLGAADLLLTPEETSWLEG